MSIAVTSDDPDQQVADTIALMRQYALEDARSKEIARDVNQAVGGNMYPQHACSLLWQWVKRKMTFTEDGTLAEPIRAAGVNKDPIVEVLVRPRDISNGAHQGDCDDHSMYLACLLTALGIPCSFATVAADETNPSAYSHVYVVAYPDGQRMPLDASHGKYPGWEAPNRFGKRTEWPVTSAAAIGVGGWA